MALIRYNPITPSQRQLILINKSHLWKKRALKSLVVGQNKSGGRNNYGRTTIFGKSRGAKKNID